MAEGYNKPKLMEIMSDWLPDQVYKNIPDAIVRIGKYLQDVSDTHQPHAHAHAHAYV